MERLAEFRPHLTGAVWRGTATRLSNVHLQLYCDDSKAAEIALINAGVDYDVDSRPGPRGGEPIDALIVSSHRARARRAGDGVLSVLDHDDLRGALKPDARGRSERGDRAALLRLMAAEAEAAAVPPAPTARHLRHEAAHRAAGRRRPARRRRRRRPRLAPPRRAGRRRRRRRAGGDAEEALAALWALRLERPEGGAALALAELRGRPLIVNFWATWCVPCVEEMPLLDRFCAQRARRRLAGGGAGDRRAPSGAPLPAARHPVAFPVGLLGADGVALARGLGDSAGGLPFSVFIDAGGRIADRRLGKLDEARLADWKRRAAGS